jgi:predicted Fe-Mo cluster-binding NifX family protein
MRKLAFVAALVLLAATSFAQQPRIVHGTVTNVAASPDLGAQIRGSRTRYIGYAVPGIDGDHVRCCFQHYGDFRSGGTCSLDGDGNSYFSNDDGDDPHPASSGVFIVLYRVENGEIVRVHSYSRECVLDANGATITWIDGVDARKSVALLASMIGRNGDRHSDAMSSLAMHADSSATTELERILSSANLSDDTRQCRLLAGSDSRTPRLRGRPGHRPFAIRFAASAREGGVRAVAVEGTRRGR